VPACPTPARPAGCPALTARTVTSRAGRIKAGRVNPGSGPHGPARSAAKLAGWPHERNPQQRAGRDEPRASDQRPRRVTRRRGVLVARAVVAAAIVAALAGAGGGDETVRLTVSFTRDGGARHVAHLRCTGARASADGFLRRVGAARACRHARRVADFLARRPARGRACTQIFGGSERARLTGRIGARRIDRRLARTDGCRIADYDHVVPLVPRPARVGP
jgi:hypothetical protein